MSTINLYVVRHGQTYYNIYRKMQGWSNSPLTQSGIDGAKVTAENLKSIPFDAAYCSDTNRAMTTLQIILGHNLASKIKPTISAYFRDGFYGSFEGENIEKTMYAAGAPHGVNNFKSMVGNYSVGQVRDWIKEADPFHQAENNEDFWHRWHKGFQLIRNDPNVKDGSNVLLIGHRVGLLSLVERFSNGQYDLTKWPDNGSLTKIQISDDDIKVTGYNLDF